MSGSHSNRTALREAGGARSTVGRARSAQGARAPIIFEWKVTVDVDADADAALDARGDHILKIKGDSKLRKRLAALGWLAARG